MGLLSRLPFAQFGAMSPAQQQPQSPITPPTMNLPPLVNPFAAPQQQPQPAPQRPQRGGLFSQLVPQNMRDINAQPTFMDWLLLGPENMMARMDMQRQQRMDDFNIRRLKDEGARDETAFDWRVQDRDREQAQRQRYSDWASQRGGDATVNPEAAYGAHMEQQAQANAPITPYQQQQLALARQGMGIDMMRAQADMARAGMERPLRGPDARLMDEVRDAAGRSQALTTLGDEFLRLNGVTGTGPETQFNPLNLWGTNRRAMEAAAAQMRAYMRPPGSGATSDYEQRIYAMGVPNVNNTGPANQAIMRYHQAVAQLSQARRYFYEDYARTYGTLNGAEQAFQGSQEFRQITSAAPLEQENQEAQGTSRGGRGQVLRYDAQGNRIQ